MSCRNRKEHERRYTDRFSFSTTSCRSCRVSYLKGQFLEHSAAYKCNDNTAFNRYEMHSSHDMRHILITSITRQC